MSLGFKGDSEAKITALKKLISTYKNSEYTDDAQYEIGVAYASDERYAEANDYFNQVIKLLRIKTLLQMLLSTERRTMQIWDNRTKLLLSLKV